MRSYERLSLRHGDAVKENYDGCVQGHQVIRFMEKSLRSEGEENWRYC